MFSFVFLDFFFVLTEWYTSQSKMEPDDPLSELDEDLLELRNKEKQQVRDFIERLVAAMLGGDLDNVVVTKPYNDKKCKFSAHCYQL